MSLLEERFDRWSPEPNTGCYIWDKGSPRNEYARILLKGKAVRVSRIVCREAYGEPPTSRHGVAHSTRMGCVGPACVNPGHLRWATQRENVLDAFPDERSERMRKANVTRTPEQRAASLSKARAAITPEIRRALVRKGHDNQTPEQRSERTRKGWANFTPEQRAERIRKGHEARRRARNV